MSRADDRANILQASTGGPDFTVKDWPDPQSAETALSAHPDDGHDHWYACVRCGVDNGINDAALHIHDWGDAKYGDIKAGRAKCVDPECDLSGSAHCPGCAGAIDIGVYEQRQPCPGVASTESEAPGLRAAFDLILAKHTPGMDTNSGPDFGHMWMTCSCGWDQDRDRVRNNFVEWEDHVRAALTGESVAAGETCEDCGPYAPCPRHDR